MITIKVAGEVIEATGNHPFWVTAGEGLSERPEALHVPAPERSQTRGGRWIDARHLRQGDTVLLRTAGPARIDSLESRTATLTVYNLRVADLSNYAVSNAGVLVHNKAAKYREPKVIQTGGHTIRGSTLNKLGMTKGQAKRAMEELKKDALLRNNFHSSKIYDNGDIYHKDTGEFLGNLWDYIY